MDVKTFIIGRKGTIGWATYESAVTESCYERSVTKDAQNRTSAKSQDEEQQGRAQINGRSRHLAVRGSHEAEGSSCRDCHPGLWHSP